MNSRKPPQETQRSTEGPHIHRLIDELVARKNTLLDEQRPEAVKKQHSKGKLTARERISLLVDEGSFIELGMLVQQLGMEAPADGVIVGLGEIEGRTVAIGASDFTVLGGSQGHKGMEKLERIIKIAKKSGYPVIFLMEGGGHRIQEGLDSREAAKFASLSMFVDLSLMSGWVPLICAIMGPGFAGPSNIASLCDFIPIVKEGTMGIAGPKLVKAALGEDLTNEELGGAQFQTKKTGLADLVVGNDEECLEEIKRFLSYLPQNASENPPKTASKEPLDKVDTELLSILPDSPNKGYDMRKILKLIMDQNSIYEIKPTYARNIITAFARIDGRPVGIVANQTLHLGGVLDAPACTKAARFVSLCDAFQLPLITFIDLPGFLPGSQSEKAGLIRISGKLQYELAQVTVPKITVIVRKAYGFAYMVMASSSDYSIAWPTAEICAMGIEGAVDVAFYREYEAAANPEEKRKELIDKFRSQTGAIRGAEGFGFDDVINPLDTRYLIAKTLNRLPEKMVKEVPPRKHGISPI